MSSYESLTDHFSKISDLKHVQAIAGWDEASMMPAGGGDARGRAMSTLAVVIHELLTDPRVPEWISSAQSETLDAWEIANVREISRAVEEATIVSKDIVRDLGLATARCEQAWRIHRAENDWVSMKPLLEEVVRISRDKAAMLAEARGCSRYDALLQGYEPGVTSARIDALFAGLKEFLPGFVEHVIDRQSGEELLPIEGNFTIERQKKLGVAMMSALGFDFEHGRLDASHHPFCGGVPDDVRITTRYNTGNFVESLMAVIHETGHAMYEQGLPEAWRDQPVGEARSAGTHESQSLLMEMQVCRTPEFLQYMVPVAQRIFLGHETNDPEWSVDNLHRLYTRVKKSHIRVDADEVTYPLHVILRYEIEKDLIDGRLEVADIPAVWDQKMGEYLGISTTNNYRDGCLQDVHWPAGLFGYFPTYTLGAMTAAQLFQAARKEIPEVLQNVSEGDFAPLLAWLRGNVHSMGSMLPYDELMVRATGFPLDANCFREHLETRYG
jgi:carboxypeptidase Taq